MVNVEKFKSRVSSRSTYFQYLPVGNPLNIKNNKLNVCNYEVILPVFVQSFFIFKKVQNSHVKPIIVLPPIM